MGVREEDGCVEARYLLGREYICVFAYIREKEECVLIVGVYIFSHQCSSFSPRKERKRAGASMLCVDVCVYRYTDTQIYRYTAEPISKKSSS